MFPPREPKLPFNDILFPPHEPKLPFHDILFPHDEPKLPFVLTHNAFGLVEVAPCEPRLPQSETCSSARLVELLLREILCSFSEKEG